jgi:nucleotide-binding universal stress UspA family protein
MTRDLRDVVNKIIVTVSDNEPTNEEIAGLASDLAAFFDAAVVLVYFGKMPVTLPPGEGPVGHTVVAAAVNVIEENGRTTLDRMAEVMIAQGIQVSSRLVMSDSHQAIKEIIEKENCDLLVIPHWESSTTQRLLRVFSPSILEDATCPVLILKGNKWLSASKAPRASLSNTAPPQAAPQS